MDEFKWPIDEWSNRKSISDFSDIEKVKYQVYLARVESTLEGKRHIGEEILYLQQWSFYFNLLTLAGDFDPEALKYLQLEIIRLFKERYGWH